MITGLDHIALICSGEISIEFYKELGFKERERIKRDYDQIVFMENKDLVLEVFIDNRHPKRSTDIELIGLRHVALKMDNFEEMAKKHEITDIKTDWHGKRFFFIFDPDGLPIEIHE